ncbi:MAG: hypothetical protein ACOVNM_02000 [Flavobacterium sp.]
MKKIIFILMFSFIANLNFSQENIIPKNQLLDLKKKYNWSNEKVLIVNYYFPRKECHYNQYDDLKKGKIWFEDNIYKKINLSNAKNIFVYSDKIKARKIIDSKTCFEDFDNYFLKNFFKIKDNCFGIIIINDEGEFSFKIGEFSSDDVILLLKNVN